MEEISDSIVFVPDDELVDGAVMFEEEDTPSNAYDHLKEAVYNKFNLSLDKMNDELNSSKRIGTAKILVDGGDVRVAEIDIEESFLNEYQ